MRGKWEINHFNGEQIKFIDFRNNILSVLDFFIHWKKDTSPSKHVLYNTAFYSADDRCDELVESKKWRDY